MTLEEKLNHFMDISVREATAENSAMLKTYQAALDGQFEAHKAMVMAQEEKELAAELEAIKRDGNQRLAHGHLLNKREISRKSAQLREKIFEELNVLVNQYRHSPEYTDTVKKQIIAAKAFAKNDDIIIYLDPEDADKKHEMEEQTRCFLTMSEYSFGGGMRAVIPARNILIDNSIDTRVAEIRNNFEFDGGEYDGC